MNIIDCVTSDNMQHNNALLIDSMDSYKEYVTILDTEFKDFVRWFIRSGIPIRRLDHHCSGLYVTGVFLVGAFKSQHILDESNPLIEAEKELDKYKKSLLEYVLQGNAIIINKRSGWCLLGENATINASKKYSHKYKSYE